MAGPLARASLLIRKPPAAVFVAFVQPAMLTQFWLSNASAPLAPGAKVHWAFMVSGAWDEVEVTAFEAGQRLAVKWSDGSTTDWRFEPHADGTVVRIEASGFSGSAEERLEAAIENTQGYTLVLSDLKTFMEQGRSAGIVRDKAQLIAEALSSRA